MKPILVFLIDGFEEIEALGTVDILRRAGLPVKTVSLSGAATVTGGHGVPVTADVLFEDIDPQQARVLVLPGGTTAFNDHGELKKAVKEFYGRGERVAALCASPMVLGGLGILAGRPATCYPGFEKYLEGADLQTDRAVVTDGNVTTGKGPGLTIDFALELVQLLAGREKREEIAAQVLVK